MDKAENSIQRELVRAAFDRAASNYDAAAALQREVANRMLERLDYVRLDPARILDVGSGTGYCSNQLARRYPHAKLFQLDFAEGMLKQSRKQLGLWRRLKRKTNFVCAEAEQLPYADASMDMVISNLTIQWCTDLLKVFSEFKRVLRPGGLLMFTTFGPDTLKELRSAWLAVDNYVHVNSFHDMHVIGDLLLSTRFADPVMDVETITLTYPDVFALMRELKQLGAHNANSGRLHGLTGKSGFKKIIETYETFRRDEVLPATHELVYGHAWVADQDTASSHHTEFAGIPITETKNE